MMLKARLAVKLPVFYFKVKEDEDGRGESGERETFRVKVKRLFFVLF